MIFSGAWWDGFQARIDAGFQGGLREKCDFWMVFCGEFVVD